ncbi:MAG: isochorismate synthase [bacterium]|nr:isochorismate synthase [bacterium]
MSGENEAEGGELGLNEARQVARAVERAREAGRTRWVAFVVDARVGLRFEHSLRCYASAGKRDRFLWNRSESGDFSVCWGVADEIESAGVGRFRDVRAWSEEIRARIDWIGDARPATAATFFGGFGFEAESRGSAEWKAFPAARFFLPEVITESREGRTRGVFIARVEPSSSVESVVSDLRARRAELQRIGRCGVASDREAFSETEAPESVAQDPTSLDDWPAGPEYRVRADRSHGIFCAQVRTALDAFTGGELSKVVLARSLSIDHDDALDVSAFLGRLHVLYPTCTLIAMGRGEDTFLAATPETLIRVSDGAVETTALAGSAPRGRHPEEDRTLAERLLSSSKERSEHAHVVEAIRGVLEGACGSLEIPEVPALRPLLGIQHLETPIRGRLKSGMESEAESDALTLVEALHPTPAVGGAPRAAAEDFLHRFERLDRGWYAAPIGWLDSQGGGDFSVALRSGLIRNGIAEPGRSGASRALLFAGAGIVEGSDPEEELIETRIKLRALLAPLTEI